MDPNELLARILKIIEEIHSIEDSDDYDTALMSLKASKLAGDVQNLHDWLSKGGFLPESWSGAHRNAY